MTRRYGLAAILAGAAVLLRLFAGALVPLPPFIFFFPAILLSGWWGGRGPGVLTTVICALASVFFWLDPLHSFRVAPHDVPALLMFLLVGGILAYLVDGFRNARETAEVTRRRLAAFLESTSDAVLGIDRQWRCTFVNRRGAEVFGRSAGEVIGRTVADVFPDSWMTSFQQAAAEVMRTGTPASLEIHHADRRRWLRHDIYSSDEGVGVFSRDVTAQKVAEERQQEVVRRERAARAESDAANRLKDEFLATLSHELRTPLNAIAGWAHLARTSPDTGTVARALEVITRNVAAQTQLIEDLLDVSRIITGKLRLDVQSVDLGPVIAAAVESVTPAAEGRGVRLQVLIDPRASIVYGDPARLQQVAWNLLSNAIKFTPRGGRVQVALRRADSRVELVVSDTGAGIPADMLPRIFDRFMQADSTSTREHQGLGLGLALVRHIVEAHGGSIAAASDGPGQGATFIVTLPVTIVRELQEPGVSEAHAAPAVERHDEHSRLDGIRVLVVDDNREAVHLVSRMLGARGAEVVTVFSAAEALLALDRARFDVVVSDLEMPGEDGYSLIRRIRSRSDAVRYTPAVALTAHAGLEDRTRALHEGFDSHLAKPVHPAELAAIVARAAASRVRAEE